MTTRIPIELHNARAASADAWVKYGEAINRGESYSTINQYGLAAEICDAIASRIYNDWQAVGGTSDIESIALDAQMTEWSNEHPANIAQELERDIDAQLDGGESSPIVSGGEVLYQSYATKNSDDSIPF